MSQDARATNPTIRELVQEASGRLSETQRLIVQYILEQPEQVVFLSADELAHEVGVSSASVVRLAQTLGFDGFYSFKRQLQKEIKLMVSPAEKIQETISQIGLVSETFRSVAEMEMLYLQRAVSSISPEQFEKAVKVLVSARRIGILGPGSSEALIHLLKFRLRRFRADIIPMTKVGGKDLFEDLHWLEKGDALLVFAFLQPRQEIMTSLHYARETGVTSVAITDLESSPVIPLADITLVGQRGPIGAFHSLVVPNAIVNALILAYAKYNTEASLGALKNFQAIRDQFGVD